MQKEEDLSPSTVTEPKQEVYSRIVNYLTSNNIKFQIIQHSATRTSKESAEERNTPLEWGSKTMLVLGKQSIFMLLYRANRRISWSKLRKVEILTKKARMCSEEEVKKLGVQPGAVPPFAALLGVPGIVDSRFKEVKSMAFNAGLQDKSIVMNTEDFPFNQMAQFDITE